MVDSKLKIYLYGVHRWANAGHRADLCLPQVRRGSERPASSNLEGRNKKNRNNNVELELRASYQYPSTYGMLLRDTLKI